MAGYLPRFSVNVYPLKKYFLLSAPASPAFVDRDKLLIGIASVMTSLQYMRIFDCMCFAGWPDNRKLFFFSGTHWLEGQTLFRAAPIHLKAKHHVVNLLDHGGLLAQIGSEIYRSEHGLDMPQELAMVESSYCKHETQRGSR